MLQKPPEQFPLLEARRLASGLYTPNPLIYWFDFLASAGIGWAAFAVAVICAPFSPEQLLACFVAALALYRATIFTHEISHFSLNKFRVFRVVWNLLCGIPLLVPSFLYRGVHMDHHRTRVYGTAEDGEYLPFAVGKPLSIIVYLAQVVILPLLALARFILLTPLAYLIPGIRRLLWERASSMSIDLRYRRPLSAMKVSNDWRWQELAALLYGVSIIALIAEGMMPKAFVGVWYFVVILILFINSLRTLAAHRYRNPGDTSLSVEQQFLDSVDIPGRWWITPLWAPVGLRFHATHHLFPGMPYHNLGRVYRRLVTELPDNRPYLQATRSGLWPTLRELWAEAHKDHQ